MSSLNFLFHPSPTPPPRQPLGRNAAAGNGRPVPQPPLRRPKLRAYEPHRKQRAGWASRARPGKRGAPRGRGVRVRSLRPQRSALPAVPLSRCPGPARHSPGSVRTAPRRPGSSSRPVPSRPAAAPGAARLLPACRAAAGSGASLIYGAPSGPAAGKCAEWGILLPGSLLRAGCFALLKVLGLGKCFPFHSWPERLLPQHSQS